ncbi:MAG: hypothetical protein IKP97_02700 [Kiritimatiellae bacterium]|nr:hypothetical protein [Kiritimatiellia bacterium]
MKQMTIVLGAMAMAFAAQAQEVATEEPVATEPMAVAEEPEVAEPEDEAASCFEASLSLDINSAYVSHNRIFSDAPVAQYDLWLQFNLPEYFGWVAVDVWANQELQKRHSMRSVNGGKQFGGFGEFDYEVIYGNSVGPVNLTASHLWYTYPRTGWNPGSQNFWTFGAEYDNAIVVPSVKLYWEYMHHNTPDDALMIDFALSRSFDLTDKLSLKLVSKTTLYTAKYAKHFSDDRLNKAVFGGWDNGVALNYALTEHLSVGAHLNYLYRIDERVRHCPGWDPYSLDNNSSSHRGLLYGGVSASLSF